MTTPLSIDRYIRLTTDNELSADDVKSWLKSVKNNAPSGTVHVIKTIDDKKVPQIVALVHRESKQMGHSYIVPLTRNLSDEEVEKIVDDFSDNHPDMDFDVATNQIVMKQTERNKLTLDQEEHLALCMAFAKQKHEDWLRERSGAGWRYGTEFDQDELTHPLLRPWDQLPDRFRVPDLEWPQKLVSMLNSQGYAIIRADELKQLMTMVRNIPQ